MYIYIYIYIYTYIHISLHAHVYTYIILAEMSCWRLPATRNLSYALPASGLPSDIFPRIKVKLFAQCLPTKTLQGLGLWGFPLLVESFHTLWHKHILILWCNINVHTQFEIDQGLGQAMQERTLHTLTVFMSSPLPSSATRAFCASFMRTSCGVTAIYIYIYICIYIYIHT